ncbi:hypothetical protein E4U54_005126 [Claviceps lovelessii]|nr:hypothetical protein E4U54_005126 [Claviceps lovelessii]
MPLDCYTDCHPGVMVGLISNIINPISWPICHIIANPGLETSLREELEGGQ